MPFTSLFAGTKNVFTEDLSSLHGYQEGVSCIVCHSIQETDLAGNANYVMRQPERYIGETQKGAVAKFVSDFLIRTYPKKHLEEFSKTLFKTPEYCAACHKQFIDEEVNQVGWVQLQNQYDNWKNSRWNHPGDPTKTIECRECHMPLVASLDPASGDALDYNRSETDDKHRSHRFLGANQFMPSHLRNLLDPSTAPFSTITGSEKRLAEYARDNRVLAFDDVGRLRQSFELLLRRFSSGITSSIRDGHERGPDDDQNEDLNATHSNRSFNPRIQIQYLISPHS